MILKYLSDNTRLVTAEERRYLIHYASKLLINDIENKPEESMEDVIESLKQYNLSLKNNSDTSVVIERINLELELIRMINDYYNGADNKEIISYNLDKLYLESDMGIRETSSLAHTLEKTKEISKAR
jgi:hypothetical protein